MSASPAEIRDPDPPIAVHGEDDWRVPLIFSSPHSGTVYTSAFVASSRLDPVTLRRSEDSFVDELFAGARGAGAPLLKALFPRAYLDVNREKWELDPSMFDGPLPDFVNSRSPRVGGGLGTVARVVANGADIYRAKLSFPEAKRRVETLYEPYHAAIEDLTARGLARFGRMALIDCHSMPSVGGPMDRDPGKRRADFVLGDAHGQACALALIEAAEAQLKRAGFAVTRNDPYAGGHITRHYGRPRAGRHALQIEVNRALYMDETRIAKTPGFAPLRDAIDALIAALAACAPLLPGPQA
ncbi:MAG: N-formylglutamate amidohydrolase [Tagaea sp.]|nr:N-formylglutamate amidohydrolase [Tagaea sp.]